MMSIVVTAIARVVPLLFYLSFLLVVWRFLFDRFDGRNRSVVRVALWVLMGVGLGGIYPSVLRSIAMVRAEAASVRQDWGSVDQNLRYVVESGGKVGSRMNLEWSDALIGMGRWVEAEQRIVAELEISDDHFSADPRVVTKLGMCRYYQGKFGAALKTFQALPEDVDTFVSEYFMGRIAHHNRNLTAAAAHYRASLDARPEFFPAAYYLVTAMLECGQAANAQAALDSFLKTVPAARDSQEVADLMKSIDAGRRLFVVKEFFFVFA